MNDLLSRLAVCSWSLQPQSADDLIEKVRACGLRAVQLHLDPIAEDKGGWQGAAHKLREANIDVVSGMVACVGEDYSTIARIEETGGVVPDATWPETRRRFGACLRLAQAMGIRLVTFHAGFIPPVTADPIRAKVRARIAEIALLMASGGVEIALETGQESAATLKGFLFELFDLGRMNVGVNFDPANMLLYGSGEPIAALEELLPFLRQVHLKDAVGSAKKGHWGREVPLGEGQVDWPEFFNVLRELGYSGALVIEREAGEDRTGDVRRGVELVRSQQS